MPRRLPWCAFAGAVLACVVSACVHAACGDETGDASRFHRVQTENMQISFVFSPVQPPRGQMVSIAAIVCELDGTPISGELAVDAVMPAHGHGMNYAPKPVALGAAPVSVRGLLFHMPGVWRLLFSVRESGRPRRASFEFNLTP